MYYLMIIAGILNGLGDFMAKLTAGKISMFLGGSILSFVAGTVTLTYFFASKENTHLLVTKQGLAYSILAGLFIGLGVVAFFSLINRGASISIMQPIIKTTLVATSVFLGLLILKEKISSTQALGFVLSLLSIYLLTK